MKKRHIKSLVFISNYFNHHQKPMSDALYGRIGKGYIFIETEKMSEERKRLGYGMLQYPSYVVSKESYINNEEYYMNIINNADVVIIGSAPNRMIKERIKRSSLVFRYEERPFKKKLEKWKYPVTLLRLKYWNPRGKKIYMLCASAYTASDYATFGIYKKRCYKWGYFPEVNEIMDINTLIEEKQQDSLLWCSRFIDWKHPEIPIEVAKRLKADGYMFSLSMIGTGILEKQVKDRIKEEGLEEYVHVLGPMKPVEVRKYMEKSEIFLFTSDRNEGWGAVLNESMNSACAVVASHAIGSVPFLVEDLKNGVIYRDGDIDDLYKKIKWLLEHRSERKEMAKEAYLTLKNEWNAENAAQRFICLAECILQGNRTPDLYIGGICSKAMILKDDWY